MHSSTEIRRRHAVSLLRRVAFIPTDSMAARSWLLLFLIGACANP